MGRYSNGAILGKSAIRLHISDLKRNRNIIDGHLIDSSVSWTSGAKISMITDFRKSEKYIMFLYNHTYKGKSESLKYKVKIISVPSNLGKGEVLYFECPITFQRCNILYLCYGSPYFKCRKAYNRNIYYTEQLSSKLGRPNDIYWKIKRKLASLNLKFHKPYYRGKPTRSELKIREMKRKLEYYDKLRYQYEYLPFSLRKTWNLHLGEVEKMLLF